MTTPTCRLQGRFNIGGRALYAEVYGYGEPVVGTQAVVIETGATMPGTRDPGWQAVRDELARVTSVFLYDRANLGQSDPAHLPRSLADFSVDLRAVLQAARIEPPYVMVGGSLGGMLVTHYASLYPQDVRGIVLVDPPHPEVNLRTLALLPAETPDEPKALADFRKLAWQEHFEPLSAAESEGLDFPASIAQAEEAWDLGDIPLIVLTAGINNWESGFPAEVAQAYEALWLELQKAYAALSTRTTHIMVTDSDHNIHENRPEVVLDAVKQVLSG